MSWVSYVLMAFPHSLLCKSTWNCVTAPPQNQLNFFYYMCTTENTSKRKEECKKIINDFIYSQLLMLTFFGDIAFQIHLYACGKLIHFFFHKNTSFVLFFFHLPCFLCHWIYFWMAVFCFMHSLSFIYTVLHC